MGQNVFEQLSENKAPLVKRMCQSPDVASTVMGYLNLMTGLAIKGYKTPVEGITIEAPVIDKDDCFKAKVHFNPVSVAGPRIWGTQSDFASYAYAKAAHMAVSLYKNPALEAFFEKMVTMIERWAISKGIRYEDVAIGGPEYVGQGPIIQKGTNMIMFKLGRRLDAKRN